MRDIFRIHWRRLIFPQLDTPWIVKLYIEMLSPNSIEIDIAVNFNASPQLICLFNSERATNNFQETYIL